MALVLLHGNPENARGWDKLLGHLDRDDVVSLSLPGFHCPRPDGFGSTRWDYRDWVIEEIERLDAGPVDVVAHDIGSMILHGVLIDRSDLVRSWVGSVVCHADVHMHLRARVWQTATLGEAARDAWPELPLEQRAEVLRDAGVPEERVDDLLPTIDWTMFDSALSFYRSLPWMGDWQLSPDVEYPPGLLLWGGEDQFQDADYGRLVANALGIKLVVFGGCGHWWMIDRAAEAAAEIEAFWAGLRTPAGPAAGTS